MSGTQVYEPQTRALLGTASHFSKEVVLKLTWSPEEQADDIEEHLWYNAVLPPEGQASLSLLSHSLSLSHTHTRALSHTLSLSLSLSRSLSLSLSTPPHSNHPRAQADDIEEHLWYNAVLPPEEQAAVLADKETLVRRV